MVLIPREGAPVNLNMDLVCRTCLSESSNMKSIFMDDGDDISNMLQTCSGLNMDALDGFPTKICSDCLYKVRKSYEFRQLCKISNKTLVHILETAMNATMSNIEEGRKILHGKTASGLDIYKCKHCPNQYTMSILLQEHILNNHLDATFDRKPENKNLIVANGNELSDVDSGSHTVELTMNCIEEKYTIMEPDVSGINLKEKECDEVRVDEGSHQTDEEKSNLSDVEVSNQSDEEYEQSNEDSGSETDDRLKTEKIIKGKCAKIQGNGGWDFKRQECHLCDAQFKGVKDLQIHYTDKHPSAKDFPCGLCDEKFATKLLKTHHLRLHSNKPFKCDKCRLSYATKRGLRGHLSREHNVTSDNSTAICEICERQFKTEVALQIHLKLGHRPNNEWNCKYCDNSFKLRQDRSDHHKTHKTELPFLCSDCNYRFPSSSDLKVHMRRHKGERLFKCEKCDKAFITSSERAKHYSGVHAGEKTHICKICGKKYNRASHLLIHTKSRHSNERLIKCSHCDKSFFNNERLKNHLRSHSAKFGKCDVCDQSFLHLEKHKRMVHGKRTRSKCDICGEQFLHLEKHKRIVHGRDPKGAERFSIWFIAKLRNFKS